VASLQFIIERFNIGVVSKIGNRTHMEDSYIIAHDLGLDGVLKASFFAVVDGHGGDWCSEYL
jgi:serine/threonine protein phosphatase PrpC